jgi:hypothetical protein
MQLTRLWIRCCAGDERPGGACDEEERFANVVVGGTAAGKCEDWGGAGRLMAPGWHHIDVQVPDGQEGCCFAADVDLEVPPGQTTAFRAYLGRFPD